MSSELVLQFTDTFVVAQACGAWALATDKCHNDDKAEALDIGS